MLQLHKHPDKIIFCVINKLILFIVSIYAADIKSNYDCLRRPRFEMSHSNIEKWKPLLVVQTRTAVTAD